jgi:hypothetical protein
VTQTYNKYELIFTPPHIPALRDLRGEEWQKLIDTLSDLPETHPEVLAFAMMIIELNGCLNCEKDSYRAQKGCILCAQQTVSGFKGLDKQLINRFENAKTDINQELETVNQRIRLRAA